MVQGSCLCKSISFSLSGELHSPRYCHCENCRKFSGTSPAVWAMTDSSGLAMTTSGADVAKFNSGRGIRCFCSRCGSPLWFESIEHPEIVAIPLGVLDDADVPPPDMHLWVQSKPTWCSIHDDLPQHDAYPVQAATDSS